MFCLGLDRGRWGQELNAEARSRGWRSAVITSAQEVVEPGYAFLRIPQWEPGLSVGKRAAAALALHSDVTMIPDATSCDTYEDKVKQAQLYAPFMPETFLLRSMQEAYLLLDHHFSELGFPFISKSAKGSASNNVRLVRTYEQAVREIHSAFGSSSSGIPTRIGGVPDPQRGYLLWQRFLAGNSGDYRVCIVGRQRMMLRRGNRDDVPFASGSGRATPITKLDVETEAVLAAADEFFSANDLRWCGIDLVRDPLDDRWRVLETTLGWSLKSYADCAFFGTPYRGSQMFRVLCDEIEAGAFDE
jgi:glutathione synthase/RimK-type ligase-like ATP-grasp enzyme